MCRGRSAATRHRWAPALLLLLAAACASAAAAAPELEERIRRLTLTAAERPADSLQRDPQLAALARAHSLAMRAAGRLAHELDGAGPDQRLALRHRRLFGLIAENVAMQRGWPANEDVARLLVNGWMNSPGHRRNILAPHQAFEVGCHGDRGGLYCTQLFVRTPIRLTADVAYRQPAGGILALRLSADADEAALRVSVGPPNEPGESQGVVWERGSAALTLPQRPGLHRLRLWLAETADASRFRLIPGPYVCVVPAEASRLPPACPGAE